MKNIFKILFVFAALLIVSCEDEDKNILPSVGAENGAVLRTIEIKSGVVDLFNIESSAFEVEVEFFSSGDPSRNALLESVDVFVRFRDNTAFNGTNDVAEVQLFTVPASAFQVGPSGFPRTTIRVAAADAVAAFGIDPDTEIDGGDVFSVRLSLNLTNGQVFTSTNRSGDIPGNFFASPFAYDAAVVCLLDPTFLTGSYAVTIISDNNPFGNSVPAGTYTINSVSATRRSFNVNWIGSFGFTMNFDLICGRIVVPLQNSGGGVGCGGGAITMRTEVGNEGVFDAIDESSFTMKFQDFVADGGCGVTPPSEIELRFDKIQ